MMKLMLTEIPPGVTQK